MMKLENIERVSELAAKRKRLWGLLQSETRHSRYRVASIGSGNDTYLIVDVYGGSDATPDNPETVLHKAIVLALTSFYATQLAAIDRELEEFGVALGQ